MGAPAGLQLPELLLWMALMAFCTNQFVIGSFPAVWECRLSHYECLKKGQYARVKPSVHGSFCGSQGSLPSQARVCSRAAQGPSGDTSLLPPTLTWPVAQ